MLRGFVYATAAGILAGVRFEFGFRRRERAGDQRSSSRRTSPVSSYSWLLSLLNSASSSEHYPQKGTNARAIR